MKCWALKKTPLNLKFKKPPDDEFICYYDQVPAEYEAEVRRISWEAYKAVGGDGYGRVDLRMDNATKQVYVLEVNAQCEIAEDEELSATGAILYYEQKPFSYLVEKIINYALNKNNSKNEQ